MASLTFSYVATFLVCFGIDVFVCVFFGHVLLRTTAHLNAAGFLWDPVDASWIRHIEALKKYKAANNDRDPPQSYQVPGAGRAESLRLGFWW
jgi:hypothetical protein